MQVVDGFGIQIMKPQAQHSEFGAQIGSRLPHVGNKATCSCTKQNKTITRNVHKPYL
eukprot:m.246596 g.246596  ORF g.246596 m.246596 type:complete len:57 (+) comp16118_c0_seq1:717-887(+)